jgi:hypothetical protein
MDRYDNAALTQEIDPHVSGGFRPQQCQQSGFRSGRSGRPGGKAAP